MVIRNLFGPIIFQSTPSSRRATEIVHLVPRNKYISIHALLTEGDPKEDYDKVDKSLISIHALLTEGDI